MRLHFLSGGRLNMRRSIYYPDAARDEWFEMPVWSALVKHRQGNVLFDTGCHPDVATNPEGRWGGMLKYMTPIFRPEDTVVHQLPKAGLTADDIDVVVCSHLHTDHCGCNAFFCKAQVICNAAELAAAQGEDAAARAYLREEWDVGLPMQTIDGQHDVFGDGRVTLIPTPGHTPGMTTAHVALDRHAFVLASDAIAVRQNLTDRFAPRTSWNTDLAVSAMDEIARLGRDGAEIIFGHDDQQWRELRTGEAFYE